MSTALTLYGLETASSTLATACKLVTGTGGTSANLTTKVGTVQNSGELFSLGSTATFPGTSVSSTAGVHGFLWDVTTLEGNNILSGTWTVKFNLNWNATYTTMTSTITARVWKRTSGGVYTKIGSDMTVAGPGASTTAQTLFTLTGSSFPSMAFATGDKLYLDVWLTVTSTGGATTRTIALWASSSTTAGIAGQVEIDTPGYSPSKVTGSSVLRTLVRSLKTVSEPLRTRVRTQITQSTGLRALIRTQVTRSTGMRTRVRTQGPSTGVYAATVLADKPLRYYRLNETSGTVAKDASGNGQDGTISATGITYSQKGLLAQDSDMSLLFASSGSITVPTTGLPTGASAWTLEAWVKFSSVPAAGNYPLILELGDNTSLHDTAIYFNGDSQVLSLGLKGLTDIASALPVTAGHTYYLAGTYDGTIGTFSCYDATAGTADVHSSVQALSLNAGAFIGADQGSGLFFSGVIDEPAIYPAALSSARIAAHYTAGTSPSKALSYPLRVSVRTQAARSAVLRVLVTATTLTTKVLSLRTLVRSQKTASTGVRASTRTQVTRSAALRVRSMTQRVLSSGVRTVVRGITKLASLRANIRTQTTRSSVLRAVIRGITRLASVRILVRGRSLLAGIRIPVRTVRTLSSQVRAVVRSQAGKALSLRTRVSSQGTRSSMLRIILKGLTREARVRVLVRSQKSVATAMRTRAATVRVLNLFLLIPVRSVHTPTASIRVLVYVLPPVPNATLLMREGESEMIMRAGDADFVVRKGEAEMVIRSGQVTFFVRSGEAAIEVREP